LRRAIAQKWSSYSKASSNPVNNFTKKQ